MSLEEVQAARREAGVGTSKLSLADFLGSMAALMAHLVLCDPIEEGNSFTVTSPASTPHHTPTQTAAAVQQRFLPS